MKQPGSPTSPRVGRILVLETDDALNTAILAALHEAAPAATIDLARSVAEAQRLVLDARPDLFVLDMDATQELSQDFLIDLRTSHPDARAIILTAVHLAAHREHAAGIGAIHFLEKPFPHAEFVDLVHALLRPGENSRQERFQGTLSDLHLSDIIQLKCMSGATSALEFTGPRNEKARIYFENGQVRHAVAPGHEGVTAFNEIVGWKGGKISEVHADAAVPRTIEIDWQFLLMEAVRQIDETSAQREQQQQSSSARHKILVIDDSPMLVSFVQEILAEANYDVVTAATATDGLEAARAQKPDLILLDYVLPDFRGDEVTRRLAMDETTAQLPILFMSGFGADLEKVKSPNVFGIVNKPFTSEDLIATIEKYLPLVGGDVLAMKETPEEVSPNHQFRDVIGPKGEPPPVTDAFPALSGDAFLPNGEENSNSARIATAAEIFFAGDTSFFSLSRGLQTIEKEKLTGVLRCSWDDQSCELYAREGRVMLATTRAAELYCAELPAALTGVAPEQVAKAREAQSRSGKPFFMTLAEQKFLPGEHAKQLVQHYGRVLFAPLLAKRARFVFEVLVSLPAFVSELAETETNDQWALNTLRLLPASALPRELDYGENWVPVRTRAGTERMRQLPLTAAEEKLVAQINGARSIGQIAQHLGLDFAAARLCLFRFVALEIVECWPPIAKEKAEPKRRTRGVGVSG